MKRAASLAITLLLTAGARADDKPAETLHLSPVPGVSFDLPKSWIACDDATNKLLGQHADPRDLKSKVCIVVPGVPYKFRSFDPVLFKTMSMLMDQHEQQDITADELAAITPEIAKAISPQTCDAIVKPMTTDGTTIESCNVTVGTFAGLPALHSIVVAMPPGNNSIAKYQIDIFELPYSKGYFQVQFNSPVAFKSVTGPEMDTIVASFKIE